ncbi:hypothetical protein EON63_21880 [archaeon]|nr:MAG: hypothetical protein EON63_21880 [archaeon]
MLLCAILSDTLNLQSPTTTEWDRLMVAVLVQLVGKKHIHYILHHTHHTPYTITHTTCRGAGHPVPGLPAVQGQVQRTRQSHPHAAHQRRPEGVFMCICICCCRCICTYR